MISSDTPHEAVTIGSMFITTMEIGKHIEVIVLILITAIGVQDAFRMAAEALRVLLGTLTQTLGSQRT
jgi:hypothetical protein